MLGRGHFPSSAPLVDKYSIERELDKGGMATAAQ